MHNVFTRQVFGNLETVDVTPDAIEYIADNLRATDAAELYASSGSKDFRHRIDLAVRGSLDAVVWVNAYGEPVGVQGVGTVSLLYNTGCPWLVGTPRLNEHLRAFISVGQLYTAQMLEHFAVLTNHVDQRNRKSVAWLQRLGYAMAKPEPYGALGLPFHQFQIER